MEKTNKTKQQVVRFLHKIAEKFPMEGDITAFTDIHIRVSQDSGDMMAFDDDDKEITRIVVEEWINSEEETEDFYRMVYHSLHDAIEAEQPQLKLTMPYNYVLENESGEHIAELYVVDDSETVFLGEPFLEDITADLDEFIENLMKE